VSRLDAGATGYLLEDAPREELIRAVRAAFKGESVLSPAVARRLMGQVRKPPPSARSTAGACSPDRHRRSS
jgi:DNA-binding NarL/FixJ family response regulator